MEKMLIVFVVFNAINVIIQTVKSIVTIRCNKYIAALINAVAYGLYVYITILTVCDLPLWQKMVVVALCNFIGVLVVKWAEEKMRKDKLWKVEATILNQGIAPECDDCIIELKKSNISFNYVDIEKYILINCYCPTQKESLIVKEILNKYDAKYFVSETKNL